MLEGAENNMPLASDIIYPTFKDAQALYAAYSILETNVSLHKTLIDIVDSSFIMSLSFRNVREIYNNIILKYYPNEACIKSAFINQMLIKGKSHVTIFELPVGNSRADLCKINGSSVAYEIKTDLDDLTRLDKQLNDYLQIFEKIFIICSEKKLPAVEKCVGSMFGIYTYSITNKGLFKFKLYRDAVLSEFINAEKQLGIVRKQELLKNFSYRGSPPRNDIITEILNHYTQPQINRIFKQILKSRYHEQWQFLQKHCSDILEIDYQWFYKNTIEPQLIYI